MPFHDVVLIRHGDPLAMASPPLRNSNDGEYRSKQGDRLLIVDDLNSVQIEQKGENRQASGNENWPNHRNAGVENMPKRMREATVLVVFEVVFLGLFYGVLKKGNWPKFEKGIFLFAMSIAAVLTLVSIVVVLSRD